MNRIVTAVLLAAFLLVTLSAAPARAESADELAREAQAALTGGEMDKALTLLTEAQGKDPRNDRVQALLGRTYAQRGDARAALEHFNQAVRLNPEDTLSRIMAETISQFPLAARPGNKATASGTGSSAALAKEAQAERETLLAHGPSRQGPLRLLIDPGHGGVDAGAPGSGLREADVALDIGLRLARALADHRDVVTVSLTRTADVTLPGWARAALAGFYDADLLVSIHTARVPDPAASGVVFFTFARTPSDSMAAATAHLENAAHKSLASSTGRLGGQLFYTVARRAAGADGTARAGGAARRMAASFGKTAPLPARPPAAGPFRLLDEAGVPAILVEAGFLSDPADAKVLAAADKRQALADALARGVLAVAEPGKDGLLP